MSNGLTYDDVAAIAESLPDVTVGLKWGRRTWMVAGKGFAWERPMSKADVKRWGDAPLPSDPILGVRVDDLVEKEAVLAANPKAFFTIEHFNGYPAFLIELRKVTRAALRDALVDGWLACAPAVLAREHAERLIGRRR